MHIQEYTAKIDKKIFEIIMRVTTTATHFFSIDSKITEQ